VDLALFNDLLSDSLGLLTGVFGVSPGGFRIRAGLFRRGAQDLMSLTGFLKGQASDLGGGPCLLGGEPKGLSLLAGLLEHLANRLMRGPPRFSRLAQVLRRGSVFLGRAAEFLLELSLLLRRGPICLIVELPLGRGRAAALRGILRLRGGQA
jgi:hypothetical protein